MSQFTDSYRYPVSYMNQSTSGLLRLIRCLMINRMTFSCLLSGELYLLNFNVSQMPVRDASFLYCARRRVYDI